MSARPARTDRLEVRITSEEKRLLVAAAARERIDVSAFIMRAALPAAQEVVARPERIVFSDRAAAQLLDLLENPPEPSEALLDAARRYLARK